MSKQCSLVPLLPTLTHITRLSCAGRVSEWFRLLSAWILKSPPTLKNILTDVKKVTFQYRHSPRKSRRAQHSHLEKIFFSTLATASPKFPLSYWNKLIPIAEITLNCLLPWHPNPAISAYYGLTGRSSIRFPCESHRPCPYCDTHSRGP